MYKKNKANVTSLNVNKSYVGESIEKKVNRIVNNKEPIKDGAPLVYTDRRDGIRPELDPRTDRWELAIDAMEKVTADKLAKRQERQTKKQTLGEQAQEGMKKEGISGTESTAGTGNPGQP